MFIDSHTHIFHPKIAHKVVHQLEGHYSIHPVGTGLTDDLVARLDRAGIDKSIVLTAATTPDQVIPANNWAIHIKKTHDRLIPFGTVHPDFDQIEKELDRLEANNIKGLKFHPDFQGFRMDDPKFFDVMEMVNSRFICLFHVGDVLPPDENPSCPKKLSKLYETFPDTTFIAAHMGGYQHWSLALECLAGTDVFVDSSSCTDFVDDKMLNTLFQRFGTDRILFGSDYPLFDPGDEIEKLQRRLVATNGEIDTILSNTAKLLGEGSFEN